MDGPWVANDDQVELSTYCGWPKRVLDILGALVALLAFGPLMIGLALLVFVLMGRPVLFRQQRPGRFERPFVLLKFRTMSEATDAFGVPLPDGQRLTSLGRLLRAASLDELPEFLNVLRGEMSLVGPRPLLTKYLPHYTPCERARFAVRPGITGLSQVSGRNDLRWDARCKLDAQYARQCCFLLDVRIISLTFLRVATRSGLRTDPGAFMADFDVERRSETKRHGAQGGPR